MLSIPITWDFSMNQKQRYSAYVDLICFQFPLLGISPWIDFEFEGLRRTGINFQFPLLGISPWIAIVPSSSFCQACSLSIPITWDFSMNRWVREEQRPLRRSAFQFPLLGISPWIIAAVLASDVVETLTFNSHYLGFLHESNLDRNAKVRMNWNLSIPITWDFSMNPWQQQQMLWHKTQLSIPITWDFSMNLRFQVFSDGTWHWPFNSHYLGFLHESPQQIPLTAPPPPAFQFPLLGISPWISKDGKFAD